LSCVIKARQDAEALIAANAKISSLLRNVILASTFATIERKEKYFFVEIEAKKKKRKRVIDLHDSHDGDLMIPSKKKIKVEETTPQKEEAAIPTTDPIVAVVPCIVT
jgi:hypothetical protein